MKEFKFEEKSLSPEEAFKVKGGVGIETGGGNYFFGYGTSTCDWNPGDGGYWTYYFDNNDDDRWRLEAEQPY